MHVVDWVHRLYRVEDPLVAAKDGIRFAYLASKQSLSRNRDIGEQMSHKQLETLDLDNLESACGGDSSTNVSGNIGIKTPKGQAGIQASYQGSQNDYSQCLNAGIKGKWSPSTIKDVCGTPGKGKK